MKKLPRIGIFAGGRTLSRSQKELLRTGSWLHKRGARITVFGLKGGKVEKFASKKGLEFIALGTYRKNYDFNASLIFSRSLQKKKIKTILFRNYKETSLLVTTKYLLKGKLRLVYLQDRPVAEMAGDFLHTFRFNQVDSWITPLNTTANEVKSHTNLEHHKLQIIPFPLRLKAYLNPQKKEKKIRTEFGLPTEAFVVGHVLKENDKEALLQIKRAIAAPELEHLHFLLAVPEYLHATERSENLATWIGENSLQTRVSVIQLKIEDYRFYSVSDLIYVEPADEPFEGVAFRAMASGVPCISPATLVASELFDYGEYGYLFPKASETAFSDALRTLVSDISLQKKLITAGKKLAESELEKDRFCENIEALIRALPKKSMAV